MKEMPVFIKIDEYKEVIEIMRTIKKRLDDAKSILYQINELKNKEDSELEEWRLNISEIEKKMEEINNSMFESENF